MCWIHWIFCWRISHQSSYYFQKRTGHGVGLLLRKKGQFQNQSSPGADGVQTSPLCSTIQYLKVGASSWWTAFGTYFLRLTAVFIFRPGTEDPEENMFFPFDPTVNAAVGWLNAKLPEPEGWAGVGGVLAFAPNVNTPEGLLFVKLKLVVVLPNWKTEPTKWSTNISLVTAWMVFRTLSSIYEPHEDKDAYAHSWHQGHMASRASVTPAMSTEKGRSGSDHRLWSWHTKFYLLEKLHRNTCFYQLWRQEPEFRGRKADGWVHCGPKYSASGWAMKKGGKMSCFKSRHPDNPNTTQGSGAFLGASVWQRSLEWRRPRTTNIRVQHGSSTMQTAPWLGAQSSGTGDLAPGSALGNLRPEETS